jgi:hypothetical protein
MPFINYQLYKLRAYIWYICAKFKLKNMKFVDISSKVRIIVMLAIFNLQNLTKQHNPQDAVIVEKLTVAHLFKTLSYVFHCVISRYWYLSSDKWMPFTLTYIISSCVLLKLSFYLPTY